MTQKYNQTKQGRKGFTIVELLIVIVVIGILAAITIVAYSGITARANTTKAQTNAANTQKVAEAFNADSGYYPSTVANFTAVYTGGTSGPSSKLPSAITISGTVDPTSGTGTTNLRYQYCGDIAVPTATTVNGGRIGYYSFSGTVGVTYVYVGEASATNWANGATPCFAANSAT